MAKKLRLSLIGILSVLMCFALAFGLWFGAMPASADDGATVTLDSKEDFEIDGGVLSGLSTTGEGKITGDSYSIIIPDGVWKIDADAFSGDAKLYSVSIPDVEMAWSDWDEEYYYDGYFEIGANAFKDCTSLVSVRLPDGLTGLGELTFYGCESLLSINIPGTLNAIPESCFEGCASLAAVVFDTSEYYGGSTLSVIGESAFANTALTELTIPYGVNTIGAYAFAGTTMTSLVIPSSVYAIGTGALGNVAFKDIKFDCNLGLVLSIFPDAKFENLNLENASYYNTWTNGTPLAFTSENATVFLPQYEDISEYKIVETLLKVSNAAIFVSPDKSSYQMVNSCLETFIHYLSTLEGDAIVYEDDMYMYIDEDSYLIGMSKDELLAIAEKIKSNHFFTATLTFTVTDTLGNSYELVEDKLANDVYENGYVGASVNYILTKDADGNKERWIYNEDYAFPTEIEGVRVNPDRWTKVGYDYDDFYWSPRNIYMGGDVALLQKVDAVIEVPEDETIEYTGTGYVLSAENARAMVITRIIDENNDTVNSAVNAGTYTVYVQLKDGCVWSGEEGEDATVEKSFKLIITKKAATLTWFHGEKDITQDVNYEIDYSETECAVELFRAEVVEVDGIVLTTENGLTIAKNNVAFTAEVLTDGVYVFTATHMNYEFGNIATFVVRVNAMEIDLSGSGYLAWSASNSDGVLSLTSGSVYIGTQGANTVIHTLRHPNINYTDVRTVENSIVRYTNKATTLSLADGDAYTVTLLDNVQTNGGMYTAKATLTAKDNYKLTTSLTNNFAANGITVTISADGKTAVVTKTWYIIELENELLDSEKSIAAGSWVEYSITGWTFGQEVTLSAPRLVHDDETTDWQTNGSVKFELILNDTVIANEFTRSQFAHYINGSMPAGNYQLIATVSVVTVGGTHTHWWNNEAHNSTDSGLQAQTFTRTYTFTVAAANIGVNLTSGTNGYEDYTWELTANADKELLFKTFADKINAQGALTLTSVTRSGYWATEAANVYYGGHTVSYNLARMNNETYLAANDNSLLNRIDGDLPDTYTVYFQITAPNHNNLTETGVDGRYAYFFTVTVYKTLNVPTVIDAGLVYTGSKVLPDIEESDKYETVWSSNDTYVNGGSHSVSFKLYDSVHYRWTGTESDTVSVNFTIGKAENSWTRNPNIVNWTYDTFDTDVNRIYAVTKFLDNGQNITFSVTKADGTAVNGLGSFTVKGDGTTDNQALISALNGLKVGAYKLNVTVAETSNYQALSASIDFNIGKSINTWADGEDDLVLPGWIVGRYNPEENIISVNAAHGEVKIIITDLDGNEYYNSETGEDNLADCAVGKYLLKAWVDETDDYAALAERTFTIEVFKKDGMPWWATLLIVVAALGVAALVLWILHEKGVLQMLTGKIVIAMRTRMTIDATIAAVRANKRAEEAKKSIAKAEALDRLEEARKAREEKRNMTPEERAAALEEKAAEHAAKAEKNQKRAERLQKQATRLKGTDGAENSEATKSEVSENEAPEAEDTANDTDEN